MRQESRARVEWRGDGDLGFARAQRFQAGSSGGLVIPYVVGAIRKSTGGFGGPTLLIAGILALAALLVLAIRVWLFDEGRLARARDG